MDFSSMGTFHSILIEMAFADLDTVEDWLHLFPHLTVSRNGDTISCYNENGFVAGFSALAPLDAAIALAFAIIGPMWPYVLPTLIKEVDAEVKRRKISHAD